MTLEEFLSECEARLKAAGPIDCYEGFIRGNEYFIEETKDMLSNAPADIATLLRLVRAHEQQMKVYRFIAIASADLKKHIDSDNAEIFKIINGETK